MAPERGLVWALSAFWCGVLVRRSGAGAESGPVLTSRSVSRSPFSGTSVVTQRSLNQRASGRLKTRGRDAQPETTAVAHMAWYGSFLSARPFELTCEERSCGERIWLRP